MNLLDISVVASELPANVLNVFLIQVLAGQYMVPKHQVRILGGCPFSDTWLTCSGELSFLGTAWRRTMAYAGNDVPLQGDLGAGEMIFGVDGVDPERRQALISLLEIDLEWRMHQVSDGERRRVQICLGLLKPCKVRENQHTWKCCNLNYELLSAKYHIQ